MASPVVALLDANVLYPAVLRDFLLRLAYDEFFRPRWSGEIHKDFSPTRSLLTPSRRFTRIASP